MIGQRTVRLGRKSACQRSANRRRSRAGDSFDDVRAVPSTPAGVPCDYTEHHTELAFGEAMQQLDQQSFSIRSSVFSQSSHAAAYLISRRVEAAFALTYCRGAGQIFKVLSKFPNFPNAHSNSFLERSQM
jgi:hypothetical protein